MASVNPTVAVGARAPKWRSLGIVAVLMAALVVGVVIGNAISDRSTEQSIAVNPTGEGARPSLYETYPSLARANAGQSASLNPYVGFVLPEYAIQSNAVNPYVGFVLPEYAIQSNGLTKAQVAEAARWTGLAEALTKADTFSPELARAVAGTQVEVFRTPRALTRGIVRKADTFSPELARFEASLRSSNDPEEAASGLLIGARHIDPNFEVGARYVAESDGTLEEFELRWVTKAQKAEADRYDGNTYQGGFEDPTEDVHRDNVR